MKCLIRQFKCCGTNYFEIQQASHIWYKSDNYRNCAICNHQPKCDLHTQRVRIKQGTLVLKEENHD